MPITVKLQGGLGNQMFQFAMGLAQARRLKTDLQLDISGFASDRMREYSLDLFPRIAEARKNGTFKTVELPATVHENGMPFNQALLDGLKPDDVLKGYWQTEKYFESKEHLVRWYFQSAPLNKYYHNIAMRIMNAKNPTFVTIRRTDYVGNSFHGELPISYYNDALNVIEGATGKPDIFVFTDDIPWCNENLQFANREFCIAGTHDRTVKGHLGHEDFDMFLMSLCRNAVMANSSFSWWGAYLGDTARWSGIVIAPKQWFGPTSNEDPQDIVPDRWIKL